MTPLRLCIIIAGLGFGHLGYLKAMELKPQFELWAAVKLVQADLKANGELDQSKSLLLCLKQLEDYEARMSMIVREAQYPSVVSSDFGTK